MGSAATQSHLTRGDLVRSRSMSHRIPTLISQTGVRVTAYVTDEY